MTVKLLALFLFISAIVFLLGCSGRRYEIIENKCGLCHSASIVYEKKRTESDWNLVIFGMKARGLVLSEAEEKELKKILSQSLSL